MLNDFVLRRPDLETLIKIVQDEQPALLWWMIRRAQQLAPDDIRDKEVYVTLAVEALGILAAQIAAEENPAHIIGIPLQEAAPPD